MSLTGRIDSRAGIATPVSSYDQWTIVGSIDSSKLTSTSRAYAFFVHGLVGHGAISTTSTNTVVEVTIGEVDPSGQVVRVAAPETIRYQMADSRLWGQANQRQMLPFEILLVLHAGTTHPNFGTFWPQSTLAIVARLRPNGDPPGGNGQFFVSDWVIVTWDLEQLGAANWFHAEYRPTQPQACNPSTSGPRTFPHHGGGASIGTTGEAWLVFWSVGYRPSFVPGAAPRLVLFSDPNGVSYFPLNEVGCNGRLLGDFGGRWCEFRHGGFRQLGVTSATTTLGLTGHDGYVAGVGNNAPGQTWVTESVVFAVRTHDATSAEKLYFVRSAIDSPVLNVVDELARPNGRFLPWEVGTAPPATGWAVLAQAHVIPVAGGAATNAPHAYTQLVHGEGFNPLFQSAWGAPQITERAERVPYIVGFDTLFGRARVQNVRYEFDWWHGLHTPFYATPEKDIADWTAIGFGFENDPSNIPLTPVTPGSIVAIVPDRESLDPGSLPPLPRSPDVGVVEEFDVDVRDWKPDIGAYRWRLPGLTSGRRTFQVSFSGLTKSELDSDLAFYDANPFVRFRPRGESVDLACLVIARPQTRQEGTKWIIFLELLELVFTGA